MNFAKFLRRPFFYRTPRETASDLNSLEPSEFEPKTNIRDINSSGSDDEEEGAEYKVKQVSN